LVLGPVIPDAELPGPEVTPTEPHAATAKARSVPSTPMRKRPSVSERR
jgi:hypothetical protein